MPFPRPVKKNLALSVSVIYHFNRLPGSLLLGSGNWLPVTLWTYGQGQGPDLSILREKSAFKVAQRKAAHRALIAGRSYRKGIKKILDNGPESS